LLEILERVENPQLGFLVDVGHLKVSARTLGFDPIAFIEQLADKTAVFHLSENDGLTDTNQLFGNDVWFADVVRKYPLPYRVIESYGLGIEEMKQALATTRSL
jgi:sugar phosphate isomerase/epimerase